MTLCRNSGVKHVGECAVYVAQRLRDKSGLLEGDLLATLHETRHCWTAAARPTAAHHSAHDLLRTQLGILAGEWKMLLF